MPALTEVTAPDLAMLLQHESAVEDLRNQVRLAVNSARSSSINDKADAIADLSAELEYAGSKLGRQIRSDRSWAAVAPGAIGAFGLMIGAAGSLRAILTGALGVVGAIVPYLATRGSHRREGADLFILAERLAERGRRG